MSDSPVTDAVDLWREQANRIALSNATLIAWHRKATARIEALELVALNLADALLMPHGYPCAEHPGCPTCALVSRALAVLADEP